VYFEVEGIIKKLLWPLRKLKILGRDMNQLLPDSHIRYYCVILFRENILFP